MKLIISEMDALSSYVSTQAYHIINTWSPNILKYPLPGRFCWPTVRYARGSGSSDSSKTYITSRYRARIWKRKSGIY